MFKRVLILSASAGNGHVRAAEALEKAFIENGTADHVAHIDALTYSSPFVRRLYSNTYIDMVNKTPGLLGLLYDAADKPWLAENRRMAFHKLNTWPLITFIKKFAPDLIICTHPLPADIVSSLICKGRIQAKHAIVVTDLDIHSSWLTRHCDFYFTALEETREHLIRLGASPAKVIVTGIPIDPAFSRLPSKEAAREALNLQANTKTIMVSAGGFGVGHVSDLLEQLVQLKQPVQLLAMCGKNSALKTALDEKYRGQNVRAIGYVRNMQDYMAASDLMVGKPGGLTTAEALASKLVMVIVNPIPGQEERNSDHLLEEGAAIRCNNLPALTYKVDKLLSRPERFSEMQDNVERLARPNAAASIVKQLLAQSADRSSLTGIDMFATPHHCATRLQRMLRTQRIMATAATREISLFRRPPKEAG